MHQRSTSISNNTQNFCGWGYVPHPATRTLNVFHSGGCQYAAVKSDIYYTIGILRFVFFSFALVDFYQSILV